MATPTIVLYVYFRTFSVLRIGRGRRTDMEMWALQAWGELALGLAAPRSAQSASGDYSSQALAWDVVRSGMMTSHVLRSMANGEV